MDPTTAVIVSFCLLGVLLYRRISLGITLTVTAVVLSLLTLDWQSAITLAYTTVHPSTDGGKLAISVILAAFGIMWLSQLYKETNQIAKLSESLSRLVRNPRIILSILPAIIGFLPVAGGALMSAPIVDAEAEKLGLTPEKKAYINVWFRHAIFPVYPLSQVLIITAALTKTPLFSIIMLQIPTVATMIAAGFLASFWRTAVQKKAETETNKASSNLKEFLVAFLPILITIVVAVSLNVLGFGSYWQGFDVLVATFTGLSILVVITRLNIRALLTPLRSRSIYDVTLAVYGAFLLRNVMKDAGVTEIFQPMVSRGSLGILMLLTMVPMVLGFLTGSPSGAIAIGASILTGVLTFTPKTSALLYISAYLGYIIAPTHLCLMFTAEYFKCSLRKVYKYVVPSFLATFAAALTVYFLPFPT